MLNKEFQERDTGWVRDMIIMHHAGKCTYAATIDVFFYIDVKKPKKENHMLHFSLGRKIACSLYVLWAFVWKRLLLFLDVEWYRPPHPINS